VVIDVIIKKSRIRSIKANIGETKHGDKFIIGMGNIGRYKNILSKIGFTKNLENGESVLPSPLGPISRYNALGKNLVHKNKPMETAYTTIEWKWEQWAGRGRTEKKSKLVDRPYKRYPRTFILPPSVELTISENTNGNKILITPLFEYKNNDEDLIHRINLFLELFGECELFNENLDSIIKTPLKRLNWEILPEGPMPWEKFVKNTNKIINVLSVTKRKFARDRVTTIEKFGPDFHAIGKAGFKGYIVFGFEDRRLYIFESLYHGNATYIFDDEWKKLSKKSKAEILDNNLQKDRIIHRKNWSKKVSNYFN
jgi:hypothetical protein